MHLLRFKTENRALPDTAMKRNLLHPDGYKMAAPILKTRRHPRNLINPHQKIASEKKAVLIEVFRQDEAMIFHDRGDITRRITEENDNSPVIKEKTGDLLRISLQSRACNFS